ncbi:uncharacterized protein LOC100374907 [Saccoglossus kowalevskii]|uniref:Uncharacterized protein LOC100374907 n=1 Tax=Saccoglossus kowalevskii TaxID=10224 RepID=A0ABM0GJN6_SACKO|nr:PREDICTED: uncharacterized protein LOC100374907 [Saccoglossus kowalevskii]
MTDVNIMDAIVLLTKKYCELHNNGNMDGLMKMYTKDCTILAPGKGVLTGRTDLPKVCGGTAQLSIDVDEIGGGGDVVFCIKRSSLRKADGTVVAGKGLCIWKKVHGEYLLYVDCWNAN